MPHNDLLRVTVSCLTSPRCYPRFIYVFPRCHRSFLVRLERIPRRFRSMCVRSSKRVGYRPDLDGRYSSSSSIESYSRHYVQTTQFIITYARLQRSIHTRTYHRFRILRVLLAMVPSSRYSRNPVRIICRTFAICVPFRTIATLNSSSLACSSNCCPLTRTCSMNHAIL